MLVTDMLETLPATEIIAIEYTEWCEVCDYFTTLFWNIYNRLVGPEDVTHGSRIRGRIHETIYKD